jgi:hypothetical protein
MDFRNGKRKADDFSAKFKKKRLLELNVEKQLVAFGLQDEKNGQEIERDEIANEMISTENNQNAPI